MWYGGHSSQRIRAIRKVSHWNLRNQELKLKYTNVKKKYNQYGLELLHTCAMPLSGPTVILYLVNHTQKNKRLIMILKYHNIKNSE